MESAVPNVVALGFLASLLAGLGTGVGALGVFFFRSISERMEDGMLSFAAGIMLAASIFSLLLPWALAAAAGAMLFIISDEIIPETQRGNFANLATFSLLTGFAVMMYLDSTLG